mgnify:FL=1
MCVEPLFSTFSLTGHATSQQRFVNYHAFLTSHHTSCKLPYMLSMREVRNIHPPLGFHCIPCILFTLGWCCHDATSTPNLCAQVRRSVKALRESRLTGVVRCGWICSDIFTLYWRQIGVYVCDVIVQFWHFSILQLHLECLKLSILDDHILHRITFELQ